jgi:hypothetical protein
MKTIFFVGDAILDNFYWLSDKKRDLKDEVGRLGFEVVNYAVDNIKMSNILEGIEPTETLKQSRSYPYPVQKDNKIYPLKSLLNFKKSFDSKSRDDMVVISIGGIDVQSKMIHALLGPDHLVNAVATDEFKSNFRTLLKQTSEKFDKVVLVSIYLPYLGKGSKYGLYAPFSRALIERWNKFVKGMAREFNISVLDLSRTLNTSERSHYSEVDDTRISNKSNKCVAECISYIFNNYKGSRIYYAPNNNSSKIIVE